MREFIELAMRSVMPDSNSNQGTTQEHEVFEIRDAKVTMRQENV